MTAGIVFLIAAAGLLYILAFYPIFLSIFGKRLARPVRRAPLEPTVSVIVPVHNGEAFLKQKLSSILGLDYPNGKIETIVISDGSTDRTEAIAQGFAERGVRLLRIPRGGKPAALNAAFEVAIGEILLLTDVRQELESGSLRQMVSCFADPEVGTVSGELIIRKGASEDEDAIGLYWRFETWMRDQLSSIDSMFGATGPFYAIRRSLAVPIPTDILLDDMYLPLAAFFRGYRLVMENGARAFDYPTGVDTEFRRKVRTLAGNYQLFRHYPGLLTFRNRMWVHYMSYKFGRLLLPWLLAAIAISSFFLAEPWRILALAAQALFYGTAAVDTWIPSGSRIKRISSPARTFVVMMAAAFRGLSVFFVAPQSLWKVTSGGQFGESVRKYGQ